MENQTVKEAQAVQTVQQTTQKNPFALALGKAKPTFTQVYGEKAQTKFLQEYGFATMQASKNKALLQCSPESVRNALIQVALTDITLNPHLNYAYLIPRGKECTLDIDYKYMIDLLIKNNIVESVKPGIIFDGEKYEYVVGDDSVFNHTPDLKVDDSQSNAIAAYIEVIMNGHKIPFVLRKSQIMNRKKVSRSHNVWDGDFWESMWIKSVIRYAYKFLPKSQKVDAVMAILNENDSKEIERDSTPEITYE